MVYLAVTQYLGFMKFGDEFKVMGLAPYGEPAAVDEIRQLVRLLPDGDFESTSSTSSMVGGAGMTWDDGEPRLDRVFSDKLERARSGATAG